MRPDALAQEVAQQLTPLIPEAAGLDVAAVAALLTTPPKPDLGHLAFPCFQLARALRMAPAKIAGEIGARLAAALTQGTSAGLIREATAAGPYLNLQLHAHELTRALLGPWARGERPDFGGSDQTVMVEYSQPNTHKAFHIGHMRNLCLGDCLVRLLRATGSEVVAANYLGDVGTHVAKCLWGLEALVDEDPPAEARGEWLGQVYAKAAMQLEDWDKAGEAGDEDAKANYARARERMSVILRDIEAREGPYHEQWARTRQWSLDAFDQIYAWSEVEFDRVFYESEVDEPGLKLVDEYLEKGVFIESRGAVGIENPEIEHMPFFMLRKSDGTGLYATKDLALARAKFEEFGIDRSIYVVDSRQSDHFKQVFLTLKKMGFAQADLCEHVGYEMVELPDGAMSSRKGNVILFRALREQLAEALYNEHFHAFAEALSAAEFRAMVMGDSVAQDKFVVEQEPWDAQQLTQVVRQVSLGAIKYGMLARDTNQKIVFEMESWTKVSGGDSGGALQYVCARSNSLLAKARERDLVLDPALLAGQACAQAGTLEHVAERAVMQSLINLPSAVARAAASLRPSILCGELYGLAKAYNRFQQECNVIHQADAGVVQARLLLVKATHEALAWGLSLLGIPAPERM